MFSLLLRLVPFSTDRHTVCKSRISETAYEFVSFPIERDMVACPHVHHQTIKHLKTSNNIHITKQDNGAGVVILDKREYVNKINVILGDTSRFQLIDPSSTHDRNDKLEVKLQKRLLGVYKSNFISKDIYNRIRLAGSQRPGHCGLLKIFIKTM